MSNIDGNVVSSFTCACIDTINKDENQEKLKTNVIDPLVKYMGKQIWAVRPVCKYIVYDDNNNFVHLYIANHQS